MFKIKWKLPKPYALSIKQWEDWHSDMKKKYPIRYFLQETLVFFIKSHFIWKISRIFYWLRCHTYTKYHLIDIRDKKNNYKWGYIDPREKLLFSSFKILKDFIEKELAMDTYKNLDDFVKNYENTTKDDPYSTHWVDAYKEIAILYKWWTVDRSDIINSIEDYNKDQMDNEMLLRLIKIREYLWD